MIRNTAIRHSSDNGVFSLPNPKGVRYALAAAISADVAESGDGRSTEIFAGVASVDRYRSSSRFNSFCTAKAVFASWTARARRYMSFWRTNAMPNCSLRSQRAAIWIRVLASAIAVAF